MYCTSAGILNQSLLYWKTVIQVISIVLLLQEKVSKAPALMTKSWIALSAANERQRPQESVSGRSALETLLACFAGSADFPSLPWWHSLAGLPQALGVSLIFPGPEGRWLCEMLATITAEETSTPFCSLRASLNSFF